MSPKNHPDTQESSEELSFEGTLSKLKTLVAEMESGELGLEEMIVRYAEGVKLVSHCEKRLQQAEGKIQELMEKKGQVILKNEEEA